MRVLAIDTSSRRRAVCLVASDAGEPVHVRSVNGGRLDVELAAALAALTSPGVDAVVVVTGPGSYTGVRSGMAAALGVAHARRLPLHGLGALRVVASGSATARWLATDAGRGGVYAATRDRSSGVVEPARRLTVAELRAVAAGERVASPDDVGLDDLERIDPVQALACAVPYALTTVRVPLAGLAADDVR